MISPALFLPFVLLLSAAASAEPQLSQTPTEGHASPVAEDSTAATIPRNITFQEELRPFVDRLWLGSPTFRAQCLFIGTHPQVHVYVAIDPSLANQRCRAQCVMRAYTSGLLLARITVPDRGAQNAELIPHELEHVIERIDGVDVKRAVAQQRAGFYMVSGGRIETDRAIRAGRQAKSEADLVTVLTRR